MTDQIKPTSAYDLLDDAERRMVDEYIDYVIVTQKQYNERVALALNYPIPPEFGRRSRGLILKPLSRAAIAERIKEEAQKQDLSPDRLIREYAALAHSNQDDFYNIGHFGELILKPWDEIPREKKAAVKTVRSKTTMRGTEYEIVMHDKKGAMDMLAQLMGMVASKEAPLLEDYASDRNKQDRELLQAPADIYESMLEDD